MTESRTGTIPQANSNRKPESRLQRFLPLLIVAVGFVLRLIPASRLFLNPDEALHNLLASQSSLPQAWQAALTNAHPPLLILLLYCWRWLGESELWLRVPSVLCGTAACWLFYEWLKQVTNRSTALLGLLLLTFAPSMILLSAEIRQYALLLFFETACLCLAEAALRNNSPTMMFLFSLSLWGALLTHYSALMFAFALGIYLLVRLCPFRDRLALSIAWAIGQIVGIAIAAYFLLTHIPSLKASGMVRADLESYLRKETYHPGDHNPLAFLAAQTLRVFTYLLSHGLIGTLTLIAFLGGLYCLLRKPSQQRPRHLALLLALPFLVNWAAALTALYPLGATRHNSFLAPFALAGAAIGISSLIPARDTIKCAVLALCLAVCNLFPAPPPPLRAKDQSKPHMTRAIAYMRSTIPAGSTILADYESGLLLGYYLCGHGIVQIFAPQQPMSTTSCGSYTVAATSFRDWKFVAATFPDRLAEAPVPGGNELWLFYSGWINDSSPAMKLALAQHGCPAPKMFGDNILTCRIAND